MNMNGVPIANGSMSQQQQQLLQKPPSTQPPQMNYNVLPLSGRQRPRYLLKPQGTCGKWLYMSPEIHENKQPFDGFAVDMWAAGVILFLMMTGK
jgi:serine/threonine protein kinase